MNSSQAVQRLKQGEVVALPTETVYGLAGLISSDEALHKIFKTKERPFFDPLIIHVESKEQALSLTQSWSKLHDFLADHLWPGPLTLIAPKNHQVSDLITSGLETVALRCPAHPVFQEVLKAVGTPLAAPSANRFGKTSPTQASHVIAEFAGKVPVVDGGPCTIGLESTVVYPFEDQEGSFTLEILRPGFISEETLKVLLKKFPHQVKIQTAEKSNSPGHLEDHYQPDKPLYILEQQGLTSPMQTNSNRLTPKDSPKTNFKINLNLENGAQLTLNPDPTVAARNLYSQLRTLSQSQKQFLYIIKDQTQSGDLWTAIWDRLKKASTK